MEKFSQLKYVRPDMEAAKGEMKACLKAMKAAGSYEEMRSLFLEQKEKEYLAIMGDGKEIETQKQILEEALSRINQELEENSVR